MSDRTPRPPSTRLATSGTCLAALLLLASCGGGPGTAPSSGGGPATAAPGTDAGILVGTYLSLTGNTATFGQSTERGIKLALDEINAAGGVLGRPIKLIVEDTQSKPEMAKTAVLKLIKQDHVVALLGEIASSRTLAAAPEAQRARVPMITPGSTNPAVTKKGDYIFRICFIDPFQGQVMAKFAFQELGLKRAAILTDVKNDYSVGLASNFKDVFTQLGGAIVAQESYAEGDADFKPQLTSIKRANPEILVLPGYYTEVGIIANQARELGMTQPLMGGDGWDSAQTVTIGGKAIEGSYFTNHYAADDPNPMVQEFIAKYRQRHTEVPDAMAALGYDSMRLLADSIKRAGSTDGQALRDAIAATRAFPAVTGAVTIDADRNARKPIAVIRIEGGQFKLVKAIEP